MSGVKHVWCEQFFTDHRWFQTSLIITFILGKWSNLTTVIVFKWAEITTWRGGTFWWRCVCIASTSHVMASWIATCEDRYEIFTQPQAPNVKLRPEHPGQHSMGKSQHLTMMDLRSGDLPQLVKVKTHIRVSPQKVYKLLLPMLSSCCIWVTHIFWGGFFASLSLSLFLPICVCIYALVHRTLVET